MLNKTKVNDRKMFTLTKLFDQIIAVPVCLFGSVKYFMYAQRMPHILNGLYIVCVKLKVVSSDFIPIIIFSIFHRHVALNSVHTIG